jgi:hypothetical protein
VRRVTHRFDFAPFERWIRVNYPDTNIARAQQAKDEEDLIAGHVANLIGLNVASVWLARRNGLSEQQADRYCCAVNIHPSLIWPDWWGPEASDLDDVEAALG